MTKASSPKPIFLLPKKPDHDDDSGSSPRGDYIAFTNTSSSNDGSFESTNALKVRGYSKNTYTGGGGWVVSQMSTLVNKS